MNHRSPIEKWPTTSADDLRNLRQQVGCVSIVSSAGRETRSSGCAAIDDLLPWGGLRVDALTEWVAASNSSSAGILSLIAAAFQLRDSSSALVVVDTGQPFYPPAAVALGISPAQIVLVRPKRPTDVVWSIDQALRCTSVGAVWAEVGSWLDDRDARRFQLAAEMGKTAGLFVRPASVRGRPSFADVRFHVDPCSTASLPIADQVGLSSRVVQLTLDRCRGGTSGKQVLIEVNDQTELISHPLPHSVPIHSLQPVAQHETATQHDTATQRTTNTTTKATTKATTAAVHLANQLAHPTAAQRSASAANPQSPNTQPNTHSNRERRA